MLCAKGSPTSGDDHPWCSFLKSDVVIQARMGTGKAPKEKVKLSGI